jgi:hypothetical protein
MKSVLILLCIVAGFGFIVSQVDKPLADGIQAYKAEMTASNDEAYSPSQVNQMNNSSAVTGDNEALTILSGNNGLILYGVSDLLGSQNFEQQLQDIRALKTSEQSYELEKKINWILQDTLANTPNLLTDILCSEDLCGFEINNASSDELSALRENLLLEYQNGSLFVAQMKESAEYIDSKVHRVVYFPYRNTLVEPAKNQL